MFDSQNEMVTITEQIGDRLFRQVRVKAPEPPAWGNNITDLHGILTGAKEEYYPCLNALVKVCKLYQMPVAVVDHGLTNQQLVSLSLDGAEIIKPPDHPLLGAARANTKTPSAPEAWLKPRSCMLTPFNHTIWIDADALPVENPWLLFEYKAPWLTRDSWVAPEVSCRQYSRLMTSAGADLPDNWEVLGNVNSGVFAFNHGDDWIKKWAMTCDRILGQPDLISVCGPRDQSALVLAMSIQPDLCPPIKRDKSLNFPANGLPHNQQQLRKSYPTDDPDLFVKMVSKDHPEAAIVHWLGYTKPWRINKPKLIDNPKYTMNWIAHLPKWLPFVSHLKGSPISYLEVGSSQGQSARWVIENIAVHPSSKIYCVDHWIDKQTESMFDHNLKGMIGSNVIKMKGRSEDQLRNIRKQFDLIYVDGSHLARDVFIDAALCWGLLKLDGVMVFDDYQYSREAGGYLCEPRQAIDPFLECFGPFLEVLHKEQQVIVRKLK